MAENYYTIITNIGKAKIANAQVLDRKVDITQIAVGDGKYNPIESQTALMNELWRGSIGVIGVDEHNPNWIVLEAMIPSDVGGFNVREVGVFDSLGALIAIGKYPETYKPVLSEGSAKDLYLRMIIEVSNASSVQIKIDPTIAIPSKDWVGKEIEKLKSILLPKTALGQPGGIATLGPDGKVPTSQINIDPSVLVSNNDRLRWNDKFNTLKSGKDTYLNFQTVEKKRLDGTLFAKSVLSNPDTDGKYIVRTITEYDVDGITVLNNLIYDLKYDGDGDLVSEVIRP